MLPPIAEALAGAMPGRAAEFQANARAAAAMLAELDAEVAGRMEAAKELRFVTFHDAYQYFEKRYGLTVPASVLDPHGSAVSASRLHRLEAMIRERGVDCIFTEPQFDARLVETLLRAGGSRQAVLDPLGSGIPPGAGHYPAMIRAIAESVESCG